MHKTFWSESLEDICHLEELRIDERTLKSSLWKCGGNMKNRLKWHWHALCNQISRVQIQRFAYVAPQIFCFCKAIYLEPQN
jgi:hypothetical protein